MTDFNVLVENVRSFYGFHSIPIKPLTILVGENSCGKTTFMGTLAEVSTNFINLSNQPFDVAPFDFGPFESIASRRGNKRSERFSIGYEWDHATSKNYCRGLGTYIDDHGEHRLSKVELKYIDLEVVGHMGKETMLVSLTLNPDDERKRIHKEFESKITQFSYREVPFIPMLTMLPEFVKFVTSVDEERRGIIKNFAFERYFSTTDTSPPGVLPFGPVRSKPRRTYDETAETFTPEGGHIPFALVRSLDKELLSKNKPLHNILLAFGNESGLLKGIRARHLSKRSGLPFQLLVKTGGPLVNLVDVGYGVSQALPIVVQSVLSSSNARLLFQQPEVHLHPKAQAALGTFFCQLVQSKHCTLAIETHSDYLLDRVRLEVSKGTIEPEMISILFFDKPRTRTRVHSLRIDKHGNLIGAPATYRRFFLQESRDLFLRTSK